MQRNEDFVDHIGPGGGGKYDPYADVREVSRAGNLHPVPKGSSGVGLTAGNSKTSAQEIPARISKTSKDY